MKPPPSRRICARLLARWMETGAFPDRMLPAETPDRASVQEMLYGAVRWKRALDFLLQSLVARDPDVLTSAYLRIGLYQIFWMDSVPAHAVLNETVEAAKPDLGRARAGFVNAVLRNSLRRRDTMLPALADQSVGIRLSHPDLLVERWSRAFGIPRTEALCEWNNRRPAVCVRVRPEHPDADELRRRLTPHPSAPEAFLMVPPGVRIESLPGYACGAFYVQDPATRHAVSLLAIQPGMRVLDACASPGGKAFACLDALQGKGLLVAADRHADRLDRLRENARRMRMDNMSIVCSDATCPDAMVRREAPYDRILLDVPCSNTGVLNRRTDARWRFSEIRLTELCALQRRMLDALAPLLAPDGILVYSTCSLEDEENALQMKGWVAANPGFRLGKVKASFPPEDQTDGAFAAQILRA